MMELRPIIFDKTHVIIGGNMRYKALIELGYKEIPDEWAKSAMDLNEEERRRFIISDNNSFGEDDWEMLANEWDVKELADWGLDIPDVKDFSASNKEIELSPNERFCIELNFTADNFFKVKEAIKESGMDAEQVMLTALNLL